MDGERGAARFRYLAWVAAVAVVAGTVALSVVRPGAGQAVVAVSRFGDAVRLLGPGTTVSLPLLERRVSLPRQADGALLEVPVELPLPGGARVPAVARLVVQDAGTLPLEAGRVRALGFAAAWGEWLAGRVPVAEADVQAALRATPLWREIFPSAAGGGAVDLVATLGPEFAPVRLAAATVELKPDPALVRSAAKADLRALVPERGRLVVLGLDALAWNLVDELVARGVMPNLGRLASRSLQATMKARPPLLSPLIWTTMATGQPPDVHGVLDFVEPDPEGGPPRPITSASRKVPAIWEMSAAAGRSTAVIGWWATFPAIAPPACTVYSDRLSEQLMGLEGDLPGVADPPEAAAVARGLAVRGSEVTPAVLAPILEVSAAELAAVPAGPAGWDDPIGGAARLMAATLTVQRLTLHELDRGTEVVLSYLEGTDTVGHLFGPYRPPAQAGTDPALAARFGGIVDRYHGFVDRWLGEVARRLRPEDTLVIVSDHGFRWTDDRPSVASGAHTPTAVFWHRPEGFFLVLGPGVPARRDRAELGPSDVASCLVALAGLPAGADLEGRMPPWFPRAAAPAAPPVDYGALLPVQAAARVELPPEAREEELAKLRALGYLGGDEAGAPAAGRPVATPTPAATAIPGRLEARRLHNLALTQADGGDLASAEANFKRAIALDPGYAPPRYGYSRILRLSRRFDEADRELWAAVDEGLGDPVRSLLRVAGEYRALGEPRRAAAVLGRAAERFPGDATVWLDLGTLAGQQGDVDLAVRCLERAAELAPEQPLAHRNLAAARLAAGDVAGARRALTRALELEPGNQAVRNQLERLGGPLSAP